MKGLGTHNNDVRTVLGVRSPNRVHMVRYCVPAHLAVSAVLDSMHIAVGDVSLHI